MTVLVSDIRAAVSAFKQENVKYKLTHGNKSSIYQMLVDDINSTKSNGKLMRRRNNRKSISELPRFVAPLSFSTTRTCPTLWQCTMYNLDSSFIRAVGYNSEFKVLKLLLGNYTYAYQNVPYSVFNTFVNSNSPGKYYARFKKVYACVSLT